MTAAASYSVFGGWALLGRRANRSNLAASFECDSSTLRRSSVTRASDLVILTLWTGLGTERVRVRPFLNSHTDRDDRPALLEKIRPGGRYLLASGPG